MAKKVGPTIQGLTEEITALKQVQAQLEQKLTRAQAESSILKTSVLNMAVEKYGNVPVIKP